MMVILISILVYIVTTIAWMFIITYEEDVETIKDIFDNFLILHWFPIINTIALLGYILTFVIMLISYGIIKLFELDKFWNKIKDIKIRKR
jgi:hypothetical protein